MENLMDKFNFGSVNMADLWTTYGLPAVKAILVLVIGLWVIKLIIKGLKLTLQKRKIDETIEPFLLGILSATLKILLVISVLSMLEVEMTAFIAIIGAAGLAVGLALQGTLQNFAGSVVILMFKPYKKGDFIEALGHSGVVKEIQIFNTIINTVDNKIIILPNGNLSNSSIKNYTMEKTRRVDLVFGIGYGDDIALARKIILEIIEQNSKILKDPAPFIGVGELGDSSVNLFVRPWTKTEDYWTVFFELQEAVKIAFDKNNISIPYPQSDVHLIKD